MRAAGRLAGALLPLGMALSTGVAAPAATGPAPPAGEVVYAFADPRIAESSGIVAATRPAGVVWTANDSGDLSRLFAVGPTGRTLAVVTVPGVATDVEDLAVGPGPGGRPAVYLADVGDNTGRRLAVEVRLVPEPAVDAARTDVRTTVPAQVRTLRYEDGPHDAEALLVHPRTGQLLLVTKDLLGGGVYEASGEVLRRKGAVGTRVTGTAGGPGIGAAAQLVVTGGAVSPDGRRIAVRTYTDVYLYEVPGDDLVAALRGVPVVQPLPETRQGEGVSWTRDGTALLTSSEGRASPVHRVPVPALPAAAPPPSRGPAERAPAGRSTSRVVYVTVVLAVAGAIFAATIARRRGRQPRPARRSAP